MESNKSQAQPRWIRGSYAQSWGLRGGLAGGPLGLVEGQEAVREHQATAQNWGRGGGQPLQP